MITATPAASRTSASCWTLKTIEGYLEQDPTPELGQVPRRAWTKRRSYSTTPTWLSRLSTLEYLRDVGWHFTVNQMVAKEVGQVPVRSSRIEGISYTEFSYMLLQAYDFLRLHLGHSCDIHSGGSGDQSGQHHHGRRLHPQGLRRRGLEGFSTPLDREGDGIEVRQDRARARCGWTPGGPAPSPCTSSSSPRDQQVGELLRYLTFLAARRSPRSISRRRSGPSAARPSERSPGPSPRSSTAIQRWPSARRRRPRSSARRSPGSARTCCWPSPRTHPRRRYRGRSSSVASASSRASNAPAWPRPRRTLAAPSEQQGGAYVNNVRQTDDGRTFSADDLLHGRYLVLRKGRKEVHIVRAT